MVKLKGLVRQARKEAAAEIAIVKKQIKETATSSSEGSSPRHHELKKTLRKLEKLEEALFEFVA